MAEKIGRRHAAIFSADVVGNFRTVTADENGILARFQAHRRNVIVPRVSEHSDRFVMSKCKWAQGDFASEFDAVAFAEEIKCDLAARNYVDRSGRWVLTSASQPLNFCDD